MGAEAASNRNILRPGILAISVLQVFGVIAMTARAARQFLKPGRGQPVYFP